MGASQATTSRMDSSSVPVFSSADTHVVLTRDEIIDEADSRYLRATFSLEQLNRLSTLSRINVDAPNIGGSMMASQGSIDTLSRLEALPRDLLQTIVEYIDERPRLLVLSLLSRRFMAICRESITKLPTMSDQRTEAAIRLLPNLTSLSFRFEKFPYPPKLRALRITSIAAEMPDAGSISSLTSLSFATANQPIDGVMDRVPSSLVHLGGNTHRVSLRELARFTALTSLALPIHNATADDNEVAALVLSRLKSYGVGGLLEIPPWLLHSQCPLENLCDLRGGWIGLRRFLPLVRRAPNLRSIAARLESPMCVAALSEIQHLDIKLLDLGEVDALRPAIYQLPRLVSLATIAGCAEFEWAKLTQLTKLVMECDHNWRGFPVPMPCLRKLQLNFFKVATLEYTLQHCPVLRRLKLDGLSRPHLQECDLFILPVIERYGVSVLEFSMEKHLQSVALPLREACKWMRVAITWLDPLKPAQVTDE